VEHPLELLRLTQEFGKLNRQAAASELPVAVATVLYYASIATALVRCQRHRRSVGISPHIPHAGPATVPGHVICRR